jgi:hypothetical protein
MGLVISRETGQTGEFKLWYLAAGLTGVYVSYKVAK